MRSGVKSLWGEKNAPLAGVVVPSVTDMALRGKTVFVDFSGATFGGKANLSGTTFGYMADFEGATFGDGVDFSGATFGSRVSFQETKFRGDVSFAAGDDKTDGTREGRLVSDGNLSAKVAAFVQTIDRQHDTRNEKALRDISFKNVQFCGDADFFGRQFVGNTDFFGATFHQVPNFHGATLGTNTKFSLDGHFFPPPGKGRLERDGLRYRLKKRWEFFPDPTARSMKFEQAYRRLKTLMMGLGDRAAEHFFYTLEVKSRIKRSDISLFEKVVVNFYDLASDFGQSLLRPLFFLMLYNLIIFLVLCKLSVYSGLYLTSHNVYRQSSIYLIRNIIPGVWINDLTYTPNACKATYQFWINQILTAHTYVFYVIAIGHNIITFVLLFFLKGSWKNRFQIK